MAKRDPSLQGGGKRPHRLESCFQPCVDILSEQQKFLGHRSPLLNPIGQALGSGLSGDTLWAPGAAAPGAQSPSAVPYTPRSTPEISPDGVFCDGEGLCTKEKVEQGRAWQGWGCILPPPR